MKKILSLVVLMIAFSTILFAQVGYQIQLPQHSQDRGISIMKSLENRRSSTDLDTKELAMQDLSDLLWAACGINRVETGKRTAPSSQNTQDIDVYVCLSDGVYRYDPKANVLNLVNLGDFRMLAEPKTSTTPPPCLLLLVADKSRYRNHNSQEHINNMIYVDAGIVSQNIGLFCAGVESLNTKPRAQMNYTELQKALKLNDTQVLILNHPVGYAKSNPTTTN